MEVYPAERDGRTLPTIKAKKNEKQTRRKPETRRKYFGTLRSSQG